MMDDATLSEQGLDAPADTPGRVLILACGALAREILALISMNGWDHMDLTCLPAKLHLYPEKITDAGGRKDLFDRTCSVCHGTDGKGDIARPIVNSTLFKTRKDCVKFIDGLMPFHNPKKCKGACAGNSARYIIDNFKLQLSN